MRRPFLSRLRVVPKSPFPPSPSHDFHPLSCTLHLFLFLYFLLLHLFFALIFLSSFCMQFEKMTTHLQLESEPGNVFTSFLPRFLSSLFSCIFLKMQKFFSIKCPPVCERVCVWFLFLIMLPLFAVFLLLLGFAPGQPAVMAQ